MNTIYKGYRISHLLLFFAMLLTGIGACKKSSTGGSGALEQSLALDKTAADMQVNETIKIVPSFDGGKVIIPNGKYSWTSDDPSIASVYMNKDFSVTVTGRQLGTTRLRLSSKDGGDLEQVCNISVVPSPVILINFGDKTTPAEWNNVTNAMRIDGSLPGLHTTTGRSTGISLKVVERFNLWGAAGATNTSTDLNMPNEVSSDYFYGNTTDFLGVTTPRSVIKFSGLDKKKKYRCRFYASRMGAGEIRDAKYTITGGNEAFTTLNASNNVNNIACADPVSPDANGNILLTITAGPDNNSPNGFYYLGAMRMVEEF
ncbi:hypothetical protein [Niabella sp.]|uniref:hypothetical protein n=1 Tax=Niabella sp. TaxID=1962976 RepID=UPI0026092153|nr:hypothetical protein [Niabella sp.]